MKVKEVIKTQQNQTLLATESVFFFNFSDEHI